MGLNAHILTITEPTIAVDNIAAVDMGQREGGDNFDVASAQQPYIRINGYTFQTGEVGSFRLRLTGKFPEISAVLYDRMGAFAVSQFPRDGDVLGLRMQARGDKYKDIRMDFHIIEFRGVPASDAERATKGTTFHVRAIAKLPGMYTDDCKSYGKATSYDHLIKIAEDLKLGFATNVEATDDEMVRLCAYQTKFDLIDKTVLYSYISDETFQTYSIDPYYYINFIDVQKLFNAEEDIEMAELKTVQTFYERSEDSQLGDTGNMTKLLLTNHNNAASTSNYIASYNLINNSTTVALENGYRRFVQYYDFNTNMDANKENLNEFFTESIVSSTIKENEEPLKGRRKSSTDEYDSLTKHKFVGLQDSNTNEGNVHLNYGFSVIHNIQNMVELDKMKLVVTLKTMNPALYRYMKVPVTIYNMTTASNVATKQLIEKSEEAGFENKNPKEAESSSISDEQPKVDEFLTGYYVIMGIEYVYEAGKYNQVLHLSRKEWPARINTV